MSNSTGMQKAIYGADYYAIESCYDKMLFKGRKTFHYIFWKHKLKKMILSGVLLDIGCGKGFFLEYMSKFYSVAGTDISKYAVLESKELLDNVPLFVADARHLCFKNEMFDIVTAFDIIEHVQNPKRILNECYSVLKPNGYIVLTTPNMDSIGRKLKKDKWFGYRDKTHVSLLYPDEWIKVIEESGFKIMNIYFDGLWDSPYFTNIPSFLQHIIFKYFSTILLCFGVTFPQKYGEDLYIIARKV